MPETLEGLVARERSRLSKERQRLLAEQKGVTDKLEMVERQLRAVEAYVEARTGKPRRADKPAQRGRRNSKRSDILKLLKDAGGGLSRGEILERMGFKGNKSGEQSVSNALSALKKIGSVVAKDRKYRVAA